MFPDLLHLNVFWFADIYINQLIQEIHLFGHKVDSGLKISGQMTKRGCLHLNQIKSGTNMFWIHQESRNISSAANLNLWRKDWMFGYCFFIESYALLLQLIQHFGNKKKLRRVNFCKTSGNVTMNMEKIADGAFPVTILETIARHISTPVPFSFLKLGILTHFQ